MSTKYDEAYDIVIAMAKAKMMMNAHKGKIEEVPIDQLIAMGMEEFSELKDAIYGGDYTHIIEEVADVLNFAVAAAYNAIEGYRKRKGEKSAVQKLDDATIPQLRRKDDEQ